MSIAFGAVSTMPQHDAHSRIIQLATGVNHSMIKKTARGSVLQENAFFANIRIAKFSPFKTDKMRSRELAKDANADQDAVSVKKRIFSKAFDAKLTALESEMRSVHYLYTFEIPSEGGKQTRGPRIISAKAVEVYLLQQTDLIDRYQHEADKVVEEYESKLDAQRMRLGDLFKESDYPHPDIVREGYHADVWIDAIPAVENIDAGRFTDSQRAKADQRQTDAVENVTRELLERLRDGTSKIRDKMDKVIADPDKTRIHDSLFDSMKELVDDIIPVCNIEGSAELEELADDVRKLTRFNTDAVRTTSSAQVAIAKEAKAIESKFDDYF